MIRLEQIYYNHELNTIVACNYGLNGTLFGRETFSLEACGMRAEGYGDVVVLNITYYDRSFKSHTEAISKIEVTEGASACFGLIASADRTAVLSYLGNIKVLLTS
ncbi:MAG: hypothetical protein HUJ51_04125 [Eggerthellaceae bacterium]|nr:hypothetical protein [Eggerthellaceae bacterium]